MLHQDGFDLWADGYDKSVAFDTIAEMEQCRLHSQDDWDSDEIYPIAEILEPELPNFHFDKITFCSGVFSFTRN